MKILSKKNLIIYFFIAISLIVVLIFINKVVILKNSNIHIASEGILNEDKSEKVVIKEGDILALTLNKTKLSNEDSSNILRELKKLVTIAKCIPGDFYEIVYDKLSDSWINFSYYPSGIFYYEISKSSENVVFGQKKRLKSITIKYEKEGTIETSLWMAMVSQGVPASIIGSFADIFAWQIDFLTDTRQGDFFKIIYEIETAEKKGITLHSKVVAAQYKTASNANSYKAFYFKTKNGQEGYFDENGKSIKSSFLKAPLQFSRISSHFTTKRFHPILKIVRPHLGIDYAAHSGTPVSSIGDGIVLKAKYSGDFGNLVVIKHNNGYETYYGHLSKYGKGIKSGVKVKQGQIIGYVGMTGLASGPHLDFRINLNGKFFDYLKIKQPPCTALFGEDKTTFENNIKNLFNNI
jgi:murein DD-endopeptidase MepM/ murein hydrolase activator NlpD